MITPSMIDTFLSSVQGSAMRQGTLYAREARVAGLSGTLESVFTTVRGRTDDHEVALWSEAGLLAHRCSCPDWREPCRHEVAAAMVLRQTLAEASADGASADGGLAPEADPEEARRLAREERVAAARREKLVVRKAEPPFFTVESPSGFTYRVHLRGDVDGPHGCDCPDFEANRLHTCKHVERLRTYMRSPAFRRLRGHVEAARRPRVYLRFGEVVEPRLLGVPRGRGAAALRQAFDADGVPFPPLARDLQEMKDWLSGFGRRVEPEALSYLERRIRRRPVVPEDALKNLAPPDGLRPYPFQWTGAEFLARRGRALLADEMGLGKTVQAILAALALRRAERPVRRVTVVCPASLRGGWDDEIRRWTGEQAVLLEGPPLRRAADVDAGPAWLVTHYEQVWRDYEVHAAHPPDLLIIDEAQRAKGLGTRTARVLKAIEAPYVFALTGTPLENRLEEAYAIAQLIDQRLLPPLWQLDRDHFVRDGEGRKVMFYRNLGELRSRLAPAFLRRRKEDVSLELPDRIRSLSMLKMHPAVQGTYDDVMNQVARIASKKVLLPADFDRMHRLLTVARRSCNGPHMLGLEVDDRSVPKLHELEQTIKELCVGEGRKAVVFSEWTDMTERVEALCRRLRLPVVHLRGSVPVRKRPALIRSFAESEGPAVFVSTDAGGVGLNLQAADLVVNLDLPWNPSRLEQRIARVHRIGSRTTVRILLLVTKDTIEEQILHLHDTKRNVLDNVWAGDGDDTIAAPSGSGAFKKMVEALLGTVGPDVGEEKEGEETPLQAEIVAETREDEPETPPPAVDPAVLARAVAAVAPTLPENHRRSLAVVFRALADSLDGVAPGL